MIFSLKEVKDISRSISITTQNFLWGRAAGRCEFAGCNKPLWKSSVTSERVNIAQKAHIYSFSEEGPRGNDAVSPGDLNSIDNLILVCHECHQKIDAAVDGGRYPAALLQEMKREHERRIELVTSIDSTRKSHIHREPQSWVWPSGTETPGYLIRKPQSKNGEAALVLSLSATIDVNRVTSVLGEDASIWVITVQTPHNDLMKSREQLADLRAVLRRVFDQIKFAHGQSAILHIFPAAPVSACLEIGRVRMPKADMPWQLYDQVNPLGGFVPALSIS